MEWRGEDMNRNNTLHVSPVVTVLYAGHGLILNEMAKKIKQIPGTV